MIRWTLPCSCLALLAVVGSALAVYPPPLKDDGKFFSKEGIEKANKKIRSIYENYKKDVVVETLASLTADQEKKLQEDKAAKFFARYASDRAKELGLNGVYVLICKKPSYLRIHMDPQTQKKAFTAANRTSVVGKIVPQFKEDKFDEGLLEGLNEIDSALKANSNLKTNKK